MEVFLNIKLYNLSTIKNKYSIIDLIKYEKKNSFKLIIFSYILINTRTLNYICRQFYIGFENYKLKRKHFLTYILKLVKHE